MIINVSWRKRRWFCKLHQTENEVPAFYREVYRNLIVQFVKSFVKIWFLLGNIQQFKILLNGKNKVQTPITFRVGFGIFFIELQQITLCEMLREIVAEGWNTKSNHTLPLSWEYLLNWGEGRQTWIVVIKMNIYDERWDILRTDLIQRVLCFLDTCTLK